ncbi:hypothetical protein PFISCL1PPCAC_19765, partial [Pristionchus fissidentatus]
RMDGMDVSSSLGWDPIGSLDDDDIGIPAGKYARMDDMNNAQNKERFARENHSEIERRRRNKMTHYINELAEMVPQCASLGRKPDKLTILRMAVTHMKSIRQSSSHIGHKPTFLSDQELKHLVLEAAGGFLFVVDCQTGRLLYVSDSIESLLNVKQEDWMNRNINELLHPDDQDKIREQLCSSEATLSRVSLNDQAAGGVNRKERGRVHLSCRRGFICRMRMGTIDGHDKLITRRPIFSHGGLNYVVVHCNGYIKMAPPMGVEGTSACLIAIARLQLSSMRDAPSGPSHFSARVTPSNDFLLTYVESRCTDVVGLKSESLINRPWTSLSHPSDEPILRELLTQLLREDSSTQMQSTQQVSVRLRTCGGDYVKCLVCAYKLVNPYTNSIEYIVVHHQIQVDDCGQSMAPFAISREMPQPSTSSDIPMSLPTIPPSAPPLNDWNVNGQWNDWSFQ